MGDFDAMIAPAGYRDTEITQEHAPQKNRGGSQLSRDQNNKRERERERERTHESRERRGWGGSQLIRDQNKKKEHVWAEKEGGGWVPVKPGLKHYKQGTYEMQ